MWLKTLKTTSLIIEKYYNYLFIFFSNNGIGSNLLNYLFLVLYNSLKPPLISLYLKLKHYSTVHPPSLCNSCLLFDSFQNSQAQGLKWYTGLSCVSFYNFFHKYIFSCVCIPKTDCFFQISFENLQKQPQTKSMITQFVRQCTHKVIPKKLLAKTLQLQEKERDWPEVCL